MKVYRALVTLNRRTLFCLAPVAFSGANRRIGVRRATVKHNGVVIYDGLELKWSTPGGGNFNKKLTEPGSLYLQDHGGPVVFNNIWAVVK